MVMPDELIGHLLKYKHVDEHRAKVKQHWAHMRQYSTWGPSYPAAADGVHYALFLYGDGATFSMNEKLTMVYTGLILDDRKNSMLVHMPLFLIHDALALQSLLNPKPRPPQTLNPRPYTLNP